MAFAPRRIANKSLTTISKWKPSSSIVFASLLPAQQIAMLHTVGTDVPSHDVAACVDPVSRGQCIAKINRSEFAPAQQIAMGYTVGSVVPSHDVAARVDRVAP